jgi:glycosyltransferase involved in cell wall biosynthesis
MRIGIDARAAVEEPGGRGRYLRELLRHLPEPAGDRRISLYARRPWTGAGLADTVEWELVDAPDPLWHLRVAMRASRDCDVFFSTNSYLTVWFLRVPSVAVVYDMVAFDPAVRPRRRSRAIELATLPLAVRRATALTAISESTKRELVERFPAAAPKTSAIPLAADASFGPEPDRDEEVLERHGVERPYVLALGTLEPRKNLPRLIEAFTGLPASVRARVKLVLAGATGWDTDETLAAIAAHADSVRALGYVPDSDLPALYRQAEVFCYPSLYEGFGLPVLEAMSCGTPVVTSDVSSLPEVGGDAVAYADPGSAQAIRDKLGQLLSEPELRSRLRDRGLARAGRYSWDRTARDTLALVESAAQPR